MYISTCSMPRGSRPPTRQATSDTCDVWGYSCTSLDAKALNCLYPEKQKAQPLALKFPRITVCLRETQAKVAKTMVKLVTLRSGPWQLCAADGVGAIYLIVCVTELVRIVLQCTSVLCSD